MSTTTTTAPSANLMALRGAIATGLAITSTSTAALNGTYAVEGIDASAMQAECNAILLSGSSPTFADGTTTLNWPDVKGAAHSFTVAQFQELLKAVALFKQQCAQYAAGLTSTLPSNTATIA